MVNREKIKEGISLVLEGMGENPRREGLVDTPERVSKLYEEVLSGMEEEPWDHLSRTFTSQYQGIVLEKDIPFYSICEHHLMPFFGKAHVAYISDGKVVGLSKLARTVDIFAKRLQIQEQMTDQIADAIITALSPKGVMVLVEAEHLCMTMRGVKKPGSKTVTMSIRGAFQDDPRLQEQFFHMLQTQNNS
jgi:GTP cyclohydrolase I